MSKLIVKKSLEIFENIGVENKEKTSSKKKEDKRIGVRKQYTKEKVQLTKTEENLKKLKRLNRNLLNKDCYTTIFKRGSRCRQEPEIEKPVEESVFTEEDFARFEREYVVD